MKLAPLSVALVSAGIALASVSSAQTTVRVSIRSDGLEAVGGSGELGLHTVSVSPNGRVVAFVSSANLAQWPGYALLAHDRMTGETTMIAPGLSMSPATSGDGRYVAFFSLETLLPNDLNGPNSADIYLRDRLTGQLELITVDSQGQQASTPGPSDISAISSDGRYVAFASAAAILVPGDMNNIADIFLRDRSLGTTTLVSVGSQGQQITQPVGTPSMSADGRFIVFPTRDPLDAFDSNNQLDAYVRDVVAGTTTRASIGTDGSEASAPSLYPAISGNGRFVAFVTEWPFDPLDTNGVYDIYVRDLWTSTTEWLTPGSYLATIQPEMSFDGQRVSFKSGTHVYLRDRVAMTTVQVDVPMAGQTNNADGFYASISADGTVVGFVSGADSLVPNDHNLSRDIFVLDTNPVSVVEAYCVGDGTSGSCPCGNASPLGSNAGCVNSLGSAAQLSASGFASTSNDSATLAVTGIGNSMSLFIQGSCRVAHGIGTSFGDGMLCVSGTIVRLRVVATVAGTGTLPVAGGQALSTYGGGVLAGEARQYQAWYRDSDPTFCTTNTFNLSNGLTIFWAP